MTVEVATLGGSFEIEEADKNLLDRLALKSVSSRLSLYTAFSLGYAKGEVAGLAAARKALAGLELPL